MDVRLLAKEDWPPAMALWKEAFGDSDAFIRWYFDNKVSKGSSLGMFEGGEMISALHMIPYTIRIQGQPLPTAFIAGAATLKKRQGQGLMRRLLHDSLTFLKSRGIAITHLYPFKHAFYEKFGWATFSHVSSHTVTDLPLRRNADVVQTRDKEVLRALYEKMMRDYDGYVIRSEREWRWRLDELESDGGQTALLLKNGAARAYMLYYEKDGGAQVIETVYKEEEDIGSLISYLLAKGYGSVQYIVPDKGTGAQKFGMARVVDVHALLDVFGARTLLEKLDVTDSFAAWNNTVGGRGSTIDITELAALVHLGADRKTSENMGHYFMPQRTCIFETY